MEKKKRASRKRGPRKGSPRSVRPISVRAWQSPRGTYQGSISVGNQRFEWPSAEITRPRKGAQLTIRQCVSGLSMATHTGLSGGTNTIFVPVATGEALVFNFSLNDLAQVANFQALFDQYRFEEVMIRLLPIVSQATTTHSGLDVPDATQLVLDFDDGTALGSENAAEEYGSCQTLMPYEEAMIRLRPAVAPAYFTSGAFSGYGVEPSDGVWLDSASASILHYGVKGWIGAVPATSTDVLGWQVRANYTVSFRRVR